METLTTIDLPLEIREELENVARIQGISLKRFMLEALMDKLENIGGEILGQEAYKELLEDKDDEIISWEQVKGRLDYK